MKRLFAFAAILFLALTSHPPAQASQGERLAYFYLSSKCSYSMKAFVYLYTGDEWSYYGWYDFNANDDRFFKLSVNDIPVIHDARSPFYIFFYVPDNPAHVTKNGTFSTTFQGRTYKMKEVDHPRVDKNNDIRFTMSCESAEEGD